VIDASRKSLPRRRLPADNLPARRGACSAAEDLYLRQRNNHGAARLIRPTRVETGYILSSEFCLCDSPQLAVGIIVRTQLILRIMSVEVSTDSHLEIGHVLFIDIVGYSKLLSSEQRELFALLNGIVRNAQRFRAADAASKLVRIPTGDGMALAFFTSVDAPVRCAREISGQLCEHPKLSLRMGINSGPIDHAFDVSERQNVTGAGINMAQRIMDCADAGHILLSRRVADDLAQYIEWQGCLHDLGEVEVKHGIRVALANFFGDGFGNSRSPGKIIRAKQVRRRRVLLWVSAVLLCLLCLGLGSWIWTRRAALTTAYKIGAAGISEKSVAVLPLENLTEEKENAYFADGIQDELLSNLAKIKDLKVISRTSVMQYKSGITRNLKEIAQQLGVANVVEGSVRRSGDRVRVSVQLIDALSDRHIWVQNYDRTVADSLTLQGELATEIAAGVGATLSPQEKARVEATPTKNTAAYDAYLRGRALAAGLTRDFSNVESAERAYREAVTLDPNFALAWVYLSSAESSLYWTGVDSTSARLAAARSAADRAVALDPNLPEIHLAIGYYRFYGLRDFKGALAEFQLAEKSLPNDVGALRAIALIQRRFARWDEVIAVMHRVIALDPRNSEAAGIVAATYMAKHQFSDAITVFDHILAFEPSNRPATEMKVYCFWAMRDFEEADRLLTKPDISLHLRGHQAVSKRHYAEAADLFSKALKDAHGDEKRQILIDLGLAQERAGNVADAKATFHEALQDVTEELSNTPDDSGPGAGLHSYLGVVHAALGDAAAAVAEGRKGMAMQPTSEDPFEGPEREEQMAQIFALLGNADEAIPIIKRLIRLTSLNDTSVGLMHINPIWDPIRNDPRFQELVAEKTR
jgi:TolB-like protein